MLKPEVRAEAESTVVRTPGKAPGEASASRIASLDQFRGYTVAGMFVVNFLGSFTIVPEILKHHNTYCSYADTIMPQFLFAVGFALRLTFGRRAHAQGLAAAYRRVARRLGGLALLSLLLCCLDVGLDDWSRLAESGFWNALGELFKRHWFQTLMHIAVTSLWILPAIRAGAAVRIAFMIFGGAAHAALSAWFNFTWVNSPPQGIDGGPLGFLTWAIPALVGTLACDLLVGSPAGPRIGKLLAWSVTLMAVGYGLSCGTRCYDRTAGSQALEPVSKRGQDPWNLGVLTPFRNRFLTPGNLAESPVLFSPSAFQNRKLTTLLAEPPFVPPPGPEERPWNYWMMSQRSGSVSYLTFAAGFSLGVFVLFHLCSDLGWGVALFRTLGTNALVAYILGGLVEMAVKPFIPRDASGWQVAIGFAVFFACACQLVRLLEKKGIVFRL